MISKARIAHHTPGRLRLKFPHLKGNALGLRKLQRSLSSLPSVTMVDINALTGSVLVLYRSGQLGGLLPDLSQLGFGEESFKIEGNSTANRTAKDGGNSDARGTGLGRFGTTAHSPIRRASPKEQQSSRPGALPIRKTAGRFLLILGVAGVLLPVVPGTPFLLAGVAVAGLDDPLVRRTRRWIDSVRRILGQRRNQLSNVLGAKVPRSAERA